MNLYSQIRRRILPQILKHQSSCCNITRNLALFTKYQTPLSSSIGNDQNITFHETLNKLHPSMIQIRTKTYGGRKKTSKHDTLSDSDSESDEDIPQEPKELRHGSKVIDIQTDSLRCDLILKNGLGIPRNKLELSFYEGRIRVNSKKIMKKSISVNLNDEVDLIKKFDEENPKFIHVGRVEVLKARPSGDYIVLTIRKHKDLLIENYEIDPWDEKPPEPTNKEEEDENTDTKK